MDITEKDVITMAEWAKKTLEKYAIDVSRIKNITLRVLAEADDNFHPDYDSSIEVYQSLNIVAELDTNNSIILKNIKNEDGYLTFENIEFEESHNLK